MEKKFWLKIPVVSKLTAVDWAVIHFKLSLGLVWVLFSLYAPTGLITRMHQLPFYWVWMVSAVAGTAVSLYGLIVSSVAMGDRRRLGFRIEMFGLFMVLSGPLTYSMVLFGVWLETRSIGVFSYALLGYALSAAIVSRMFMVAAVADKPVHQDLIPPDPGE